MKYKDSYKYMKGGRDKFGNIQTNPRDWWEVEERRKKKAENRSKRNFVRKMYDIDKHWVRTLSEDEMKTLYSSWSWNQYLRENVNNGYDWHSGDEGDGSHESIEDFIKFKKKTYGNIRETRDLKIEDLFKD